MIWRAHPYFWKHPNIFASSLLTPSKSGVLKNDPWIGVTKYTPITPNSHRNPFQTRQRFFFHAVWGRFGPTRQVGPTDVNPKVLFVEQKNSVSTQTSHFLPKTASSTNRTFLMRKIHVQLAFVGGGDIMLIPSLIPVLEN